MSGVYRPKGSGRKVTESEIKASQNRMQRERETMDRRFKSEWNREFNKKSKWYNPFSW